MEITDRQLERLVLTRVMRLNAAVQGIVLGIVFGMTILIATLWLVVKGGPVVGPHLVLLGQFFIGYDVTVVGSLIGFGYGFGMGFAVGFFVAKIYNLVADRREQMMPAPAGYAAGPRSASQTQGAVLHPTSGKESSS